MPWHCSAGTIGPRLMGLKYPTWMPTGKWSWTISCRAGSKRGQLFGSYTPLVPVAQKTRDNSRTSPSDLFLQLGAKWQQRPETPVLISRIHTSSSHHAPHQCSDFTEEWLRPGANHPPRAEQHHTPRQLSAAQHRLKLISTPFRQSPGDRTKPNQQHQQSQHRGNVIEKLKI